MPFWKEQVKEKEEKLKKEFNDSLEMIRLLLEAEADPQKASSLPIQFGKVDKDLGKTACPIIEPLSYCKAKNLQPLIELLAAKAELHNNSKNS